MKKRMKIANYLTVAVVILSSGLFSCDRHGIVSEGAGSGVEIPLQVKVLGIISGNTEEVIRSGHSEQASDPVVMPLGDGMLLEMSVEPDLSELRAGTTQGLESGTAFRVIAVKSSDNTYVSHGDFTVGGATSVSTFHVPGGASYKFICISYHTASLPAATGYVKGSALPSLAVDGSSDLLWAVSDSKTVNSAADAALSFTLAQQLSQVELIVDCSYNGWNVTGITNSITLGQAYTAGVTMNYVTGVISASTTGTKSVTWPVLSAGQIQTSNALKVVPKASGTVTVSIPVGAVTRQSIGSIPLAQTTVSFPGFAFVAGNSYKIRLKLKTPKLATSNIYWNGSALYFDEYSATPSTASQQRQGVFFKWGSLVGISPVGTGTTAAVYYPSYNSGSSPGWISSTVRGTNAWGGTTYASIPYADNTSVGTIIGTTDDRTTNKLLLLSPAASGNPGNWNNLRGDICEYINGDYRIPTSFELGSSSSAYSNTTFTDGADPNTATGSGSMGSAGITFTAPGQFFPASGYRSIAGLVSEAGLRGYYWSGSVSSSIYGYCLLFRSGSVVPINNSDRQNEYTVRCVKK